MTYKFIDKSGIAAVKAAAMAHDVFIKYASSLGDSDKSNIRQSTLEIVLNHVAEIDAIWDSLSDGSKINFGGTGFINARLVFNNLYMTEAGK